MAESAFALTTMFIAVPTGVKIFNWLGTIWGGSVKLNTPMLFSLGFIFLFVIGGLSGVTHAIVPADAQQHDTYYVVAHFHYVLFGGAIFGVFSGIYFWWPKITGKLLGERLGKWNFWTDVRGHEPDLRPDAHAGPQRHAAPHLPLRRGPGLRPLEPGGHHRVVHPGHRCRCCS